MTHLSPDELGDVDAVAGHEHLRTCARCREQWQQQLAVRELLRGLPDPGPTPPDVSHAITDALGRLSADDVERPAEPVRGEAAAGVGATVVPLSRPVDGRRRPGGRTRPWLAAAAAVIVLGGGGAALATHTWTGASGSSSDTAAGAKSASGAQDSEGASQHVYATGTRYTRTQLASQVRSRLLAGTPSPLSSGGAPPRAADGSAADDARLASPQGLASCLSALGVDAGQVLAVDLATFDGRAAAVLALRDSDGAQDVWVVGRGCRQGDDQTRLFLRLP